MKTFERVCKICGRKFEGNRNFQKYCDTCKNFSDFTKATGLFYNCDVERRISKKKSTRWKNFIRAVKNLESDSNGD